MLHICVSCDNKHTFGIIEIQTSAGPIGIEGCTKCGVTFNLLFEMMEMEFKLDTGKIFFRCEGLGDLSSDELIDLINQLYPCKLNEDEGTIKDIIE